MRHLFMGPTKDLVDLLQGNDVSRLFSLTNESPILVL